MCVRTCADVRDGPWDPNVAAVCLFVYQSDTQTVINFIKLVCVVVIARTRNF